MTSRKLAGKRLTALLLCTIMLLSIFSSTALLSSANEFVTTYNDFVLLPPEEPEYADDSEYEEVPDIPETSKIIIVNNTAVPYTIDSEAIVFDFTIDVLSQVISSETGTLITFNLVALDEVSAIVFPRLALERIAFSNFGVEIITPHGLIALNRQVLASIVAQGDGTTITIYFQAVPRSELSEIQQHVLSPDDYIYFVQILAGTYSVTNFTGALTIMVPYSGESPVGVWRLFGNGRLEDVPSIHDATRLTVTFMPNSLSLFVVGIDLNAVELTPILIPPYETLPTRPPDISEISNPFVDVQINNWFYDPVLFVYANGIMGATSLDPMTFSPNANLTRSMIVTILHRLEGAPSSAASNPFTDVSANAWYTDAVIWAADAGIVTGVADSSFDPGAYITRQDLAVIFVRYARHTGTNLLPVTLYNNFTDQSTISAYAVPAVRQIVESGIMGSTVDNLFSPHDNATRAQAAAMLHRLIGLG